MRSRKNILFDNFLARTETKERVECIRKNLLIQASKDERLSNNNQLPPQMQKFMQAMELKRKIQEATKENEKVRRQEKALLDEIYRNGKLKFEVMNVKH